MNILGKMLLFLERQMPRPTAYGWFHLLWLLFVAVAIIFLYHRRTHHSEKQLKQILGIYGVTALVLEILKQLIWTFQYDSAANTFHHDFQWYAFPFQLCTTPIFVSLICLFLKKGKLRDFLLSYMAYITIIGSISVILVPNDCFVSDVLVNIHTMWLHLGSFVVSVYLLMSGEVPITLSAVRKAIPPFLGFVAIANTMNILIYQSGVLNGETFNMFYISPYFESMLPVFHELQGKVPYALYLGTYVVTLICGAHLIYAIARFLCGHTLKQTSKEKGTFIQKNA